MREIPPRRRTRATRELDRSENSLDIQGVPPVAPQESITELDKCAMEALRKRKCLVIAIVETSKVKPRGNLRRHT